MRWSGSRHIPAAWRRGAAVVVLSLANLRERANVVGRLYRRSWRTHFRRQVLDANAIRSRERDRALQGVLQFANIPRPRISQEQVRRLWRKRRRSSSQSRGGSGE